MVFGAISAIRTSGEMPAFRADGVGSGSVTVGDGGGVIGGDGSGPVVVITNVSMVADFGSTGGDAGIEENYSTEPFILLISIRLCDDNVYTNNGYTMTSGDATEAEAAVSVVAAL